MAISASSYSVGNRLYKGATSAPTRGRVDPSGYVDRELNKVASSSRSGIASAALRRMGSSPGTQQAQTQQPQQQAQPSAYGQQSQVGSTSRAISAPSGTGTSTWGALRVSPVGKLAAPKLETALPFDPDAADAQTQLLGQKNRFESDFTQAQQDLERQYTMQARDMELERPHNERNLLENYAGRGLAYSSGYAHDTGELQGQYARMRGDLEGSRTNSIADLLRQRGLFNNDYSDRMNSIQQAAARRAAERAAELELGVGVDAGIPQNAPTGIPTEADLSNPVVPEAGPMGAAPSGMVPQPVNPQRMSGGTGYDAFGNTNAAPIQQPTVGAAPQQAPMRSHDRTMQSFDPRSRTILSQGGTIRGGNGMTYKFDPNSGMVVPA